MADWAWGLTVNSKTDSGRQGEADRTGLDAAAREATAAHQGSAKLNRTCKCKRDTSVFDFTSPLCCSSLTELLYLFS